MEQRILPASRREQILGLIAAEGFIRVSDAADVLQVSPITIRRDIASLAEEGLVEQVRGGARKTATAPANPPIGITLAMMAPTLDFYWPTIIEGAGRACDDLNIRLKLQGSTFAARDNLEQIEQLAKDPSVNGLMIAPDVEGDGSDALIDFIEKLNIPIVMIERQLRPFGPYSRMFESVVTDHQNGADQAVRHFAELGHKRLALLTDKRIPSRHLIRQGWQIALSELKLDTSLPNLDTADFEGDARTEALVKFVEDSLDAGVTGILVQSDEAALVVVETLQAKGLEVPDDISVIAYDDEIANLARPQLTAISPAKAELGATAVRVLARRITTPDAPGLRTFIQPRLIVRASTGKPRNHGS